MKKLLFIIPASLFLILSWGFFVYLTRTYSHKPGVIVAVPAPTASPIATSTPVHHVVVKVPLPAIQPKVSKHVSVITATSPKILAYAHGTVAADGQLFIGMASRAGNPFPSNEVVVFNDPGDISRSMLFGLSVPGDIETLVYDPMTDKVYFVLSGNSALRVFSLDPHVYTLSTIVSTSTVDAGTKPAIVSDGTYIYGITNTNPSKVFRVRIYDGELTVSATGHIPNGHSAAMGVYDGSSELYFTSGTSNQIEKVDPMTLKTIAETKIEPCTMSDDMPFEQTSAMAGYLYIGCETVPYGLRVRTGDLSYDRFSLPGASLGMFLIGNDLYNAAEDSSIDVFPGRNLAVLERYRLTDKSGPFTATSSDQEINEILYSPETNKLFVTAWWGIQGLFQIATSTGK